MTSNHPEKLDPALIRPGRVNLKIHLGYVELPEATEMVQHYFGGYRGARESHVPTPAPSLSDGGRDRLGDEAQAPFLSPRLPPPPPSQASCSTPRSKPRSRPRGRSSSARASCSRPRR